MQTPFCLIKTVTFICRYPDGVVTSGVPVSALDENDLVCENVISMCRVFALENSAAVWLWCYISILKTAAWSKMLFFFLVVLLWTQYQ